MPKGSLKIDAFRSAKAVAQHPLEWIFESFEAHPGYQRRKLFGCQAAYFKGRLCLAITAGEEPWNGLLVATCREYHAGLQSEWPGLKSHAVLGKWLYISQDHAAFERVARGIARIVLEGDARIGVAPSPRKRKRQTVSKKTTKA